MEIRVLKYFLTVAQEQSFSKAAKVLNVSQPALSKQIKDLEEEYQITLFNRTTRSLSLTEEGRLFKEQAKQIISLVNRTDSYLKNINKYTLGSLLKLVGVRIVFYILVIVGFFVFFPHLMADKIYMMAVLIYFMCPTGFAMPMLISPLNKSEEDEDFTAAFISLFMVITLIVYTYVVLFIA